MDKRSGDSRARAAVMRLAFALLGATAILCFDSPGYAESRVPELTGRALSSTPDPRHGELLFQKSCAQCHRKTAWGSDEGAVPALAGQHPSYLIKQMAAFIEFERQDEGLHRTLAQAELSRPQSLADLGAYLGSLAVQAAGRQPRASGDSRIADGEQLYSGVCTACHGSTAEGDAEHFIPTLRGQNYSYLLTQMRRFAHGHRFDTPDELLATFDAMTSADMEALASYLSHLPPIPARTTTRQDSNAHGEKDSHHRWPS